MMHLFKTLPILIVIGMIGIIVSCESDKATNPQDQSPTIPPQSSMIINFDEFPDTSTVIPPDNPNIFGRNWEWAASNVAVWNSVLTITLAIPVAAFNEAFNHQPIQQSDGSWLWQYSLLVQEELITAKLYGKTVTEGVEWRMLLSRESLFTDFEWFTGFSNLPVTEGNWTLNKNPESPTPFLYIEWKRNDTESTADVKYTSIVSGSLQNGSYIHYGKTNEIPYNRFYQIFGAEENHLVDIKWNYEQHFGRVKDAIHFEDNNWHCWDENLEDILCLE